jgi:hypothetical protein
VKRQSCKSVIRADTALHRVNAMTTAAEFRALLPTWALAVLLPIPMVTFWSEGSGRAFAYCYLFLGTAVMAAESFGRGAGAWRAKLAALSLGAAGAVGVYTLFAWAISGRADWVVPVLATLAVVPALGCVPYLTLATGRPHAAVLFVVFILAAVKMAGCVVVRVVYGPTALADGRMSLPWEAPNLLVWLCLVGALACSAVMLALGRAFLRDTAPGVAGEVG